MCGGAIISEISPPATRSSSRLTADLLWGSGAAALSKKKKKNDCSYYWKPLRSKPIVDFDDDFEADFQDFEDYSDDEDELDLKKPFAFFAPKNLGVIGNPHYPLLITLFCLAIYLFIYFYMFLDFDLYVDNLRINHE